LLTALHFGALSGLLLAGRWIRELGGSESQLGWFSASIVPGIVCGAWMAGRLAAHIGEKRLIIGGIFLTGILTATFAGFDQISAWFVPIRFGQGFGHGMVFTSLISLTAHSVSNPQKSQGMGYIALCAQLGNASGVAIAENLLLPHGFAFLFLGCSALTLFAWVAATRLPRFAATNENNPEIAGGMIPTALQNGLAILFFVILGGSYGTVLQLIPLLVADLAHAASPAPHATPVMAAIFFTVAACRLFLARLADSRFRQPVLIASTLLLIVATAGWPLTQSIGEMVVVAIFFALGYGLLFPGLNGLVLSSIASSWRSRASGRIVMAFDGGFFGLLLLLGPIAETFGYMAMFAILGLLQLAAALLFLAMIRQVIARRNA